MTSCFFAYWFLPSEKQSNENEPDCRQSVMLASMLLLWLKVILPCLARRSQTVNAWPKELRAKSAAIRSRVLQSQVDSSEMSEDWSASEMLLDRIITT